MAKSKPINETKAETLRRHHQWLAVLALKKALSNEHGGRQQLDWVSISEAAFHAGAATVLYELTF
jgi:hypothetical protein